jgi:hypothetical protein
MKLSPDRLVSMVRSDDSLAVAALHVFDLIRAGVKCSSKMARRAVVGAMWECVTSRWETKALDFFKAISDPTTVGAKGTATRTIYDWIHRMELNEAKKYGERRTDLDWFNACVQSFNYFRAGKPLTRIARPKKPGRIHISHYDWRDDGQE